MYFTFLRFFLAAAILLLEFGLSTSASEQYASRATTVLKPINIHDFEAATGVYRRAAKDFSHLDLRTQAELIYGSPGGKFPCSDHVLAMVLAHSLILFTGSETSWHYDNTNGEIANLHRQWSAITRQHDPIRSGRLADRHDGAL